MFELSDCARDSHVIRQTQYNTVASRDKNPAQVLKGTSKKYETSFLRNGDPTALL
jgi:hypothetical protein